MAAKVSSLRCGMQFLLVSLVFWLCSLIEANEGLTQAEWRGYLALFPVPRQKISDKLSQLKKEGSCHATMLTLPNKAVLPGLIGPDQHVVAVGFGHLRAKSVDEALPEELRESYSTESDTVQFYIPYLTGEDPDAAPRYKLAINSFVSTDHPFIQPNVAFPTSYVDDVTISNSGLRVQNGSDSFVLSFADNNFCEFVDPLTDAELELYNRELTTSHLTATSPSVCWEKNAAGLDICSVRIPPCPCQFWHHGTLSECNLQPVTLEKISKSFQDVSLLTGDEKVAVVTVANAGDFSVELNMRCH